MPKIKVKQQNKNEEREKNPIKFTKDDFLAIKKKNKNNFSVVMVEEIFLLINLYILL